MNGIKISELASLLKKSEESIRKEFKKLKLDMDSDRDLSPRLVREYLIAKGYRYPQQVVSFQMLKGGVAKTTSALQFAIRAAQYGTRVLVIDLDQQANLTYALGVESENASVWVDVVEKKVTLAKTIKAVGPFLDLVPSNLNNSVLDRVLLTGNRNWSQAVKGPLAEVRKQYDLVIIDTAPSLSMINTAVTLASDVVVLPVAPDRFSLLGAQKHLADLAEIEEEFGHKALEKKILFTRFDGREKVSEEILGQCVELFDDMMMKSFIRASSELKNTIGTQKTIFQTANKAAEDYDLVTRELLGFGG